MQADMSQVSALPEPALLRQAGEWRPGELREAVRVVADGAKALRRAADQADVEIDLAAGLLLELQLIAQWCPGLLERPVSRSARPTVALSAAEGDYLRRLVMRRSPGRAVSQRSTGDLLIHVPVRLVARTDAEVLARAMGQDLERAIAWEVSALCAGLQMGEWAARILSAPGGG